MIPTCRRAGLVMLAIMVVLAVAPSAFAHTDVATTTPAAGETVDSPLDRVTVTFAEALAEDGDHALGVYAPDGETRVDLDDLDQPDPQTLAVGLGELSEAGTYEVRWVIVAADGDEQRGDFTFELSESAVADSVTPSETEPVLVPSPTEARESDDPTVTDVADGPAESSFPWVPLGAVAVAILAVGAWVASRSR